MTWEHKLPSFKTDVLTVLFREFPRVRAAFDFRETRSYLCTPANLATLLEVSGAQTLTQCFQAFFETRAVQEWSVLIPLDKANARKDLPSIGAGRVRLRKLRGDEQPQLREFIGDRRSEDYFFVVEERAGDAESAIRHAREHINEFLTPYYLHRMRNRDGWWSARTARRIVSPLAFYVTPEGHVGAKRELEWFSTDASDLFTPDPPLDRSWKNSVEKLAARWEQSEFARDTIEERLCLCSRWMFSAESDELQENAFLKHAVAWEALMPSMANRLLRCWYLLLFCLGTADRLCVKTISQASRLIDRRNSFAHPEANRELYGTLESDLTRLKQSVWRGFDEALRLWQSSGGEAAQWSKLLANCYEGIRSDDLPEDYDQAAYMMLDRLRYIEEDEFGKPVLNRSGHCLRVEAYITRARQLWDPKPTHKLDSGEDPQQNPKDSVASLARGLQVSMAQNLPRSEYHVLLTIEDRMSSMNCTDFEHGWRQAAVTAFPPTKRKIAERLKELERDDGVDRRDVGWKKQ